MDIWCEMAWCCSCCSILGSTSHHGAFSIGCVVRCKNCGQPSKSAQRPAPACTCAPRLQSLTAASARLSTLCRWLRSWAASSGSGAGRPSQWCVHAVPPVNLFENMTLHFGSKAARAGRRRSGASSRLLSHDLHSAGAPIGGHLTAQPAFVHRAALPHGPPFLGSSMGRLAPAPGDPLASTQVLRGMDLYVGAGGLGYMDDVSLLDPDNPDAPPTPNPNG